VRADARALAANAVLAAALGSIGYAAFALTRVRAFGRTLRAPPRPARRPPVVVLKPVRGLEPRLEQNLRSFCAQDYPGCRVVLGVRDADDPALPLLRRLADEAPERVEVVVGGGAGGIRNPKIANLVPMLAHEPAWDDILALEPGARVVLSDAEFHRACVAMADFADLKSPFSPMR